MTARYSITPGDFADDKRAQLIHHRVMHFLGTKTDRAGWCTISQVKLAERFEVARETVNRAVRDLVAWGYVDKRSQAETHRAICAYRVLMDRHEPTYDAPASDPEHDPEIGPESGDGTCDLSLTGGVEPGGTCDVSLTGRCDAADHTRVTHHVTLKKKTPLNNDQEKTPLPRKAGEQGSLNDGGSAGEADDDPSAPGAISARQAGWTRILEADGRCLPVLRHLLAPLLTERRFSASQPVEDLRAARNRARQLSPAHLAKVLELLLGCGVQTIKPARLNAAIDAVIDAGLMLRVQRRTPQWDRWLHHYRATDPRRATIMDRYDSWQVPSEWPPALKPEAAKPGDRAPAPAVEAS